MFVGTLILLPFCLMGVWKIHDLLLPKSKPSQNTFETTEMLSKFFAELTYKTMKNLDQYEDAPLEVYKWLMSSFKEWHETRWKK